jgi:hypothetical protein
MFSKPALIGKDWTLSGYAYIAKLSQFGYYFNYSKLAPANLDYFCLIYAHSRVSSLERTFDNLVVGKAYRLSFYYAPSPGFQATSFEVSMGDLLVYSTVPSTSGWEKVSTKSITANSNSLAVKIAVTGNNKFMSLVGLIVEESGMIMYVYMHNDVSKSMLKCMFMQEKSHETNHHNCRCCRR